MAAYSVVMFICSAVIFVIAYLFYKGNNYLMTQYEQRNVRDKLAYGKMLGKGYFIMSFFFAMSGIVGLLGDTGIVAVTACLLLLIGMIVGVCYFVNVREKYSAGFF